MRSKSRSLVATSTLTVILSALILAAPRGASAERGVEGPPRMIPRASTVSVQNLISGSAAHGATTPAQGALKSLGALHAGPEVGDEEIPAAELGGRKAPGSKVLSGGGDSQGFPGIDLLTQETAGTGDYKDTGGGLEPPDQALCVGNGFVMEGVNQAWRIYNTRGVPLTRAILLAEFFDALPGNIQGLVGPTSFLSDPKCVYDPTTKRFFATTLEIDEASTAVFTRAHNYIAVSKTSDPTKDWYLYKIDVTDDGLMDTPLHATCPCLGDQPLIGFDRYGFYMSTNEYSDSEVLPAPPPPAIAPFVYKAFALPDFRNGQAQVYALSKRALISGAKAAMIQKDTADEALPADAPIGSLWSSLQPSFSPPGDGTSVAKSGIEYFMSQLDFAYTTDNRVAVWALTNTSSIDSPAPNLQLLHTIITTLDPADTYSYANSADQKAGPIPVGHGCLPDPCDETKLNANDDRMNQVMLTNGHLWSAVNTLLPPIDENGSGTDADPRTGIMYFDVQPQVTNGTITAKMVRDGYVNVPKENVLFPSVAASPKGPVVMSFTLSGIDYYPSAAWTRLDGLKKGQAPVVHVSGAGVAPEDGFTGYCVQGIVTNVGGQCQEDKARWGDYSASIVDENGCAWSGTEYISSYGRDEFAGDWATYITRVSPAGCHEPPLTPAPEIRTAPCLPLITDPAGNDDYVGNEAGVDTGSPFKAQNPQLDIVKGDLALSKNGKELVTTITLKDLSNAMASPGGTENDYYMVWTYRAVQYFSAASVGVDGSVSYTDGRIEAGSHINRTEKSGDPVEDAVFAFSAADAGSFNEGSNGTVVVHVPLSGIGKPKKGEGLFHPTASTSAVIGGLLNSDVDTTTPRLDYRVGQVCIASAKQTSANPGVQVKGTKQTRILPATGVGDSAAYLLGLLLVATAGAIGRRMLGTR